jgi:hypothetical protein
MLAAGNSPGIMRQKLQAYLPASVPRKGRAGAEKPDAAKGKPGTSKEKPAAAKSAQAT